MLVCIACLDVDDCLCVLIDVACLCVICVVLFVLFAFASFVDIVCVLLFVVRVFVYSYGCLLLYAC